MKRTSTLRIGTRGSELALVQTRWVCDQLRTRHPDIDIEEVIIATHGDRHPSQSVTSDEWPMGGFTSAIEQALLERRIDFAVHSMKDLPVRATPGTVIASVPVREAAHDVLIAAEPVSLDALPAGMKIGTSSPRRTAQIRRCGDVKTIALRGNVPTRLARVGRDLDGIILAAAGLRRLGVSPQHVIDLPLDRFLPAPGQGALAVQSRSAAPIIELLRTIDDRATGLAVTAEGSLLSQLGGGCGTPIGAYAAVNDGVIHLRGQMFRNGGEFNGEAIGDDPTEVAFRVAVQIEDAMA